MALTVVDPAPSPLRPSTAALPPYVAPPDRRPRSAAVYRRRRLAALLLAACLFAGLVSAGRQVAAAFGSAPASAPERRPASSPAEGYVVRPGDSLWSVARRMQPHGDVRPLVHRLERQVGSDVVHPGQVLYLP